MQPGAMKTGSVSFSGHVAGLQVSDLRLQSEHPNINFFVCDISGDGLLDLKAELDDLYFEDWPVESVVQEAQQFMAILSLEFNCQIHRFHTTGVSLKKRGGSDMTHVVASHTLVWDSAEAKIRPSETSIENFRSRYHEFRHSTYPGIYAAAVKQQDPVTRFMFLYYIILMLSGDRQAEVDLQILRLAPDTPTSISPHQSNMQETIYTRLRNEIAHIRVGATIDSTSTEIADHVAGLGEIIRRLILESR